MEKDKTGVERAFEMAREGRFDNVTAIKRAVAREGYETDQIVGPILRKQLRDLIRDARRGTKGDT
jgi:hypothetical protein